MTLEKDDDAYFRHFWILMLIFRISLLRYGRHNINIKIDAITDYRTIAATHHISRHLMKFHLSTPSLMQVAFFPGILRLILPIFLKMPWYDHCIAHYLLSAGDREELII